MNDRLFELLNTLYQPLNERRDALLNQLSRAFKDRKVEAGYYAGHLRRQADGAFMCEHYPIPVIAIAGLCDIEIHPNKTGITSKLAKQQAMRFIQQNPLHHSMEIYGLKNYLQDVFQEGSEPEQTLDRMRLSAESEFFISFPYPKDTAPEVICRFVQHLQEQGFYY